MQTRTRRIPRTRRSMAGVSLVELMVGITLGLLVLAGLAGVFANSSRARSDIERSSRQIENGRYALEVLTEDIRLAGFYGEYNPLSLGTLPTRSTPDTDVCSTDPAVWQAYMNGSFYGFDNGSHAPSCLPGNLKPNTDIVVVRRVAGCEAGVGDCPGKIVGLPYFQTSKCNSAAELGSPTATDAFRLGLYGSGSTTFDRTVKDCNTVAGMRRYIEHIYYIANDNGQGQATPTLMRLELNPNTPTGFDIVPLVEGIEQMNIEYGIDYLPYGPPQGDGQPDGYTADPSNYVPANCDAAHCTSTTNWANVVSARINILSRNIDATPNYTDHKTYTLGLDALGQPIQYTPNDGYQRHAYNTVVRVENVSQRRDLP